jgi:hypothetical protein
MVTMLSNGAFIGTLVLLKRKTRRDRVVVKLKEVKTSCVGECISPSSGKGCGCGRSSPASMATMQCRPTSRHLQPSGSTSPDSGGAPQLLPSHAPPSQCHAADLVRRLRRPHDITRHSQIPMGQGAAWPYPFLPTVSSPEAYPAPAVGMRRAVHARQASDNP